MIAMSKWQPNIKYHIEDGPSIRDIGLHTCYQSSLGKGANLRFKLRHSQLTNQLYVFTVKHFIRATPISDNPDDGRSRFVVEVGCGDRSYRLSFIYNPFTRKGLLCSRFKASSFMQPLPRVAGEK